MQGFSEFTEEKKIVVKTKMGGEIPATIKVTGKDYHIVKTDSGKQYKVDHQGNSLEEEIDDKDLPFTPDKKKTKPSTPGKYGDAYSTVRNLARKALEKQKQVKEEEQIDEKSDQAKANKARKNAMDTARGHGFRLTTGIPISPKDTGHKTNQQLNKALGRQLRREELDLQEAKSKQELQALMRKYEQHAIDANKRGDDATVIKHQQHISNIKKKLERVVRNEEVEIEEAAPVAPSLGVHRIQVTVSDPDHTMVSQRKEKVQKFVRVTSNSKENALEQGKKHFAKKGWKVHDAEHVGMVHEEVDMNEGYRGSSKADEPYWEAEAHKKEAEKARKSGDNFSYHKFMSAHHDALAHWNTNKGRHHVADQHAMKADNHEDWAQEARKEKK